MPFICGQWRPGGWKPRYLAHVLGDLETPLGRARRGERVGVALASVGEGRAEQSCESEQMKQYRPGGSPNGSPCLGSGRPFPVSPSKPPRPATAGWQSPTASSYWGAVWGSEREKRAVP